MGGVTFLTLHVVGSNNNRARTKEADAEYEERNEANLAWMRAGFAHAKSAGSRAVTSAVISQVSACGSPTARPPTA